MAEVRVYQTADKTPLATLRDDILTHIRDVFPSFRSLVENVSIYNEVKEEILFFARSGALCYVKFIRSDRAGSMDYVIDDYMNIKERWARFCKNDKHYATRAEEAIDVIIVSERFDDSFVKRIRFVATLPVTLLEVRTLKGTAGEIAYALTNVHSQTIVEKAAIPAQGSAAVTVQETAVEDISDESQEEVSAVEVRETSVVETAEAPVTEKAAVDEKPDTPVADEGELTVTREEVAALQGSGAPKEYESDFFERAQLNAEEEREFFLLNQQLSESIQH